MIKFGSQPYKRELFMHTTNRRFTILSSDYAVGPEASPMTLRMIKMLGYASVVNICDQDRERSTREVTASNVHEDTTYRQFSVDSIDNIDDTQIQHFSEILNDIPKPVFVFSENGLRATAMWAASMMGTEDWQDIKTAASRAGHDVSFLQAGKPKSAKSSSGKAAIATA
ncbi:MAG: hypothetical protein V3U76_14785 [Granulosicoccus sp.]